MNNLTDKILDELVFDVRKPARYTGGEINRSVKTDPLIKIALSYPDLYEIGMANHGIKILYDLANQIEEVACERVFAVDFDFEKKLRDNNIPLYTLETYTPLNRMDIIGFNIAHELLYTNILQILDLGQIPLLSKSRVETDPVVIAGGAASSNPAPVKNFFDVFFLGDGEEGLTDILNTIIAAKKSNKTKDDIYKQLNEIEGVYVPSIADRTKKRISKRIYRGNGFRDPIRPVIPNIRISQERFVVELTKGCRNQCKFCHAGYYELPYRYDKPEAIRDRLMRLIENRAYTELTLSSLCINDYRHLIKLLNMILPVLNENGISISLPSLRLTKNTLPVIEQISDLRRTSLTFAVESASDHIRASANKNLCVDDLLFIADHVFRRGWKLIKLYFMLGLPGCNEYDEAGAIIELLKKLQAAGGKKRNINVTISPFVPKPHTPFQWEKQMDSGYFLDSIARLKKTLPRSISIKAHDVNASLLEGIMARGDQSLAEVIHKSYIDGCRFDSWNEHFNFDVWKKNLDDLIPAWKNYLDSRDIDESLPWDNISTGYERLVQIQRDKNPAPRKSSDNIENEKLDIKAIQNAVKLFEKKYVVASKVRLTLSKTGKARYIPHLDFAEIIKRSLRMADIPVSYTQGFNKRERISLGFPLPIGIESISELCDVDLYENYNAEIIKKKLSSALPDGFGVIDVKPHPGGKSLMSAVSVMEYKIIIQDDDLFLNARNSLKEKIELQKTSRQGVKKIAFNAAVLDYTIDNENPENKIIIRIYTGGGNSLRIDNLALMLAGADYDSFYKFKITKISQYRKSERGLVELI